MLVLVAALWRRRVLSTGERRAGLAVGGAMAASVLVILGFTLAELRSRRGASRRSRRTAGHPAEGLPVVVGR